MVYFRNHGGFGIVVLLCLVPVPVLGQGYAPDEAPGRMTVPPGFEVTLVACEPMVRQPVAIEFDDRGRMWVIQYLQYPNPAGLERVEWDRYSRTTYDRVPEPPPHGPKGADRVTILEDTDGDGRADKAKDFIDGLNLATGIAFGHGGVYIVQAPYLLFYPDRNRDDVPDGDPEVLLKGFGMEDASAVANSLIWGPDGWLYGLQGSTVTANIRGIEFQQGVWRYHPLTKAFELFCEGGGNIWGLDYDRHGHFLISSNGGPPIIWHGVQGGYYWKSFGKHGPLHNPYTFGFFGRVPYHGTRRNHGHVTVGGVVYQADVFPERFHGAFIGANLLTHNVYWYKLLPLRSTFETHYAGELVLSNDTWVAASDMATGPGGAVYLVDWHDRRTAHPDPDVEWDRSNGRIFRIAPKGAKPAAPFDLAERSSDELVALLAHRNNWYERRARVLLASRRDRGVIGKLRKMVSEGTDHDLALRALWTLYASGGFNEELAGQVLRHPSEDLRYWAIRFLGDAGRVSPAISKRLAELAATDPSPRVRSQLASAAKKLATADALPIVQRILQRNEDGKDHHIPLLLWWAIERHAVSSVDQVLERFASRAAWKAPMIREHILGRLIRRYAAEESEVGFAACVRLLHSAATPEHRSLAIAALDEGLRGRRLEQGAPALREAVAKSWTDDTTNPALMGVLARLGDSAAYGRAASLADASDTPEKLRVAVLGLLAELGRPDCLPRALTIVGSAAPEAVGLAALDVVRQFEDDGITSTVLKHYPDMTTRLKGRVHDLLFAREASAMTFLRRIDGGEFAADQIPVEQVRGLTLHENDEIDALVRKLWGRLQPDTPEDKLAEVRRLNNDVRAAPGDPAKGKAIFTERCATCHLLFGEGNNFAPDLTQANRKDRNAMLVNIVDPSAVVRKEFQNYIVRTKDQRILTGLIVEETPTTVVLADAQAEKTTIARDAIESIDESMLSIMPEGLYEELSPAELRDLFSYLESDEPIAGEAKKPGASQ